MELITTLGIDWKMLVAQLINFGILLAILTYFVYKPLMRVIDDRRERVKKSIDDARHLEDRVRHIEKEQQERRADMNRQAKEFMEQAKQQAENSKQEILSTTQREVDQLLDKGRQQLQDEKTKLLSQVQNVVTKISIGLAEKILEREFSDSDQQRLVSSLEKDLPTLLK